MAARRAGRFSVTWNGRSLEFGFTATSQRKKFLEFPPLEPSGEDVKVSLAASAESGPAARVIDSEGDAVYSYHHRLAKLTANCALIPLSLFVVMVEHFGGPAVQNPRVSKCAAQCCRRLFDPK